MNEGDTFSVYSNNTNQGHGPYSKLCIKRKKQKTKFYISYQPRKQGYWDIDYISGLK